MRKAENLMALGALISLIAWGLEIYDGRAFLTQLAFYGGLVFGRGMRMKEEVREKDDAKP